MQPVAEEIIAIEWHFYSATTTPQMSYLAHGESIKYNKSDTENAIVRSLCLCTETVPFRGSSQFFRFIEQSNSNIENSDTEEWTYVDSIFKLLFTYLLKSKDKH